MTQQYWQGDLVQEAQIDSYHDLTLKVQMGFDFVLLLKAYNHVLINPFMIAHFSQRRKVSFIWETVL